MLLSRIEKALARSPAALRLYNHPVFAALYNRLLFLLTVPPRDFGGKKLGLIYKIKPYTLLCYRRLSALHDAASALREAGPAGAIVECGSWRGGAGAMLAAASGRTAWLFDSWEGLPEPGEHDVSATEERARRGMFAAPEQAAREIAFERLRLPEGRLRLVKGWFDRTLPARKAEIGPIALLHVDADLYGSVKTCFEQLWDQVVPGGYVFVDDYGNWRGCRKAVDEFAAARGLSPSWTPIDYTGVCLRK